MSSHLRLFFQTCAHRHDFSLALIVSLYFETFFPFFTKHFFLEMNFLNHSLTLDIRRLTEYRNTLVHKVALSNFTLLTLTCYTEKVITIMPFPYLSRMFPHLCLTSSTAAHKPLDKRLREKVTSHER